MITDNDVKKIRKALKPDFAGVEQKVREALKPDFDRLDQKIEQTEKNIKKYIHEGVDAAVAGVDNLLTEYQYDVRIKKLENIHPQGRHSTDN